MLNPQNSLVNGASPNEVDETVEVISIKHWTKNLFSFRLQRPKSFRFNSGEFVLLGLKDTSGKPILRAYSIASPSWDDTLLFYSIYVEDGPLTSMLSKIKKGDGVLLKRKDHLVRQIALFDRPPCSTKRLVRLTSDHRRCRRRRLRIEGTRRMRICWAAGRKQPEGSCQSSRSRAP